VYRELNNVRQFLMRCLEENRRDTGQNDLSHVDVIISLSPECPRLGHFLKVGKGNKAAVKKVL
jgi:hypothetical protein